MFAQTLEKNISRDNTRFNAAGNMLDGLRTVPARLVNATGALLAYMTVAVVMLGVFCASTLNHSVAGKDLV